MNPCYHLKNVLGTSRLMKAAQIRNQMSCVKKKKALVFLPKCFEEIEVITPVDILRRGGVQVTIAGMCGPEITNGGQKVRLEPDIDLDEACGPYDAMILTGDKEAVHALKECERVCKHLTEQEKCGRIIAAICMAPCALLKHDIGKCKKLTSHPDAEDDLRASGKYNYQCTDVVVDDYLITARGPAQAMQWALTILMHLTDEYNACCIARKLLVK